MKGVSGDCICCGEFIKPLEKFSPLWLCTECDYGRQIEPKEFHYSRQYQEKYLQTPELAMSFLRLSMVVPIAKPGSRVLDYGCGSGAFVHALKSVGYDAQGFNVGDENPEGAFNVVTMFDVIEHLPEPSEVFKLNPEFFVISVPDFKPVASGEIELKKWRHYRPDEHIHYFSYTAIRRFFQRHGYDCIIENHTEDYIRKAAYPNILTCIFKRRDA